ncbi:hypothetical protein CR513_15578, partial [Mucuna pruriens]
LKQAFHTLSFLSWMEKAVIFDNKNGVILRGLRCSIKNQEDKGKDMSICWCFAHRFHEDHDSQYTKINMRLFEGRAWRG